MLGTFHSERRKFLWQYFFSKHWNIIPIEFTWKVPYHAYRHKALGYYGIGGIFSYLSGFLNIFY